MKKLAILVLNALCIFSMTACNLTDAEKDAVDETVFRQEYIQHLSKDSRKLAEFLFAAHALDQFVTADSENRTDIINKAVIAFAEDEEIHQQALEKAKEIFAETHIDCNWEALRDLPPTPILPIATNAETGEPISNKPAGSWSGPAD